MVWMDSASEIAGEFGGVGFGDKRLDDRFVKTAEQLGKHAQGSILSATGGRNGARGFYRLLENDKFSLLATNLAIESVEDCMEIVGYYVLRWQIERFHYVLKSGYQVEKIQQRTVGKVKSMLFIYSVLAMYVMRMTFMARVSPDLSCDEFLDESE